jgi:hypothetical protein
MFRENREGIIGSRLEASSGGYRHHWHGPVARAWSRRKESKET